MRIEEVELSGYTRLMLSNISKLHYTPTLPWQLVLGSNGSGKSSLLAELSLLPANPADYFKGGYKKIRATHNGSTYETISLLDHGPGKHTFIKDGEKLNNNGTATVQRQLVEKEFGLTDELHQILIGKLRFTDMVPTKRREWVTKLSTADYTYALTVFKKLKVAERDALGATRFLQQRMIQTTTDLKALPELEGLDQRADRLRAELNLLLTSRVPNLAQYSQIKQRLYQTLQDVETMSREVQALVVRQPAGRAYASMEEVKNDLSQRESEVNATQTLLNHYTRDYSDLESIISSITLTGESIPENIEGAMLELEGEAQALTQKLEKFSSLEEAELLRRDTHQVLDQVIELWQELPENRERKYSRERSDEAREHLRVQEQIVDTAKARLSQIEARLSVMNSAKDTSCPDCGFTWRDGYSEDEAHQHQHSIENHNAAAAQARAAIKEIQDFLEQSEQYSALYTRFRGFVSSYPRLRPLWNYLVENKCLTDSPQSHMGIFYAWRRDVETTVQIEEKRRRMQHLSELAMRADSEGGHFSQRLAKLHAEIETTTGALHDLRTDVRVTKLYHDQLVRLEQRASNLQARLSELETLEVQALDALRNQEIDATVAQDQNELALIQRQLTDKHALDGVIADLTHSLEHQELDHAALAMLTQALSPTEGVIAEQLTGFIGCLVAQLNSIIATVWSYDLTVLPCGLESGELDYKFPVRHVGLDQPRSDISKASTAQKEIIDFAFVLTVMLYLDMADWPLYLDELGAGFDDQHRISVMNFVHQLMDVNRHSQVFMISHYASNHGSLANAETLVLHTGNIAVLGDYNKHVTIS
jgi:ABC-type cobalamin/Fe3+-siderophores transport system ATPase subunit